MSEENIISANQMINKIFQNITVQEDEKSISAVWRKTVLKVYNYGEKLASHSEVVDLKNGILLVETDHPGWIQIMQSNRAFILKGLKMNIKDVEIKSLAFRLKGSEAVLSESYEESLKKAKNEMQEKLDRQEENLEKMGFTAKKASKTDEIPDNLKKLFEEMARNADTN